MGFQPMRQMLETIEQATKVTAGATQVMVQTMLDGSRTATTATQDLAQKTCQSTEQMSSAYNTVHGSMTRVLGVLAGGGLAVSATGLNRGAIETTASFENLDVQLRFLLGDVEKFQQARQFILRFTMETPLQLGEVTKDFSSLTRAGLDAQKILPGIIDVVSLQQFPGEALSLLVKGLTDVQAKGKLAGEELRQMANMGVPLERVVQELGKLGVHIQSDIGQASVDATKGIQAILNALQDYRGAVQATLGNLTGIISNLRDVWARFQDLVVRRSLFDYLRGIADLLREQMQNAVEQNSAAFQAFGGKPSGC